MVFRYPGSKNRFIKYIEPYLKIEKFDNFYEPFAGGGSIFIFIAKKNKDIKLYVNDLDENIYSFWKLFELDDDNLFNILYNLLFIPPTIELFKKLRNKSPNGILEKAYYSIFFNRTTFSGIYRSGPIGGYEQKGKYKINCRYNFKKIVKEIKELRILLKDRIKVYNLNYEDFIFMVPKDALMYLDPPYYKEGKSLYNKYMQPCEHQKLSLILKARANWVLSYDKCDEIRSFYDNFCELIDVSCKYSVNTIKNLERQKRVEYIIIPKNSLTFSNDNDILKISGKSSS